MASDVRIGVTLACEECKRRNYETNKSRRNTPDRIEMRKFCRWCGRHTRIRRPADVVAKTRAQKAERRRRQQAEQRRRQSGAGAAEREREERAQEDTQHGVSGEVAEAEAVLRTGADTEITASTPPSPARIRRPGATAHRCPG